MATVSSRIIFISYAHEDREFVNELASILVKLDMQVWKDSKDIPVGGSIIKSIFDGIKNSSHFCCIISRASINSAWVEEELSFAKKRQVERGLLIVPILVDSVEIPDYLTVYRCAHLEDRNMSFENPEFAAILKAFGVSFQEEVKEVVTGEKRVRVLRACEVFLGYLTTFRQALVNVHRAYVGYDSVENNQTFDVPYDPAGISKASHEPPTTFGWEHQVEDAREALRSALKHLASCADHVSTSIKLLSELLETMDLNIRGLAALRDLNCLDLVSNIADTVLDACDEKAWWIPKKLSIWVDDLIRVEGTVQSTIALFRSWAVFDSDEEE